MNLKLEEKINLFFLDPKKPRPPRTYGVLHSLRKDISNAYGDENKNCRTLFLGAMGIFAGIDLLAKLADGNDDIGKVGKRFHKFLRLYADRTSKKSDREIVYQLRNALIHSFGLRSESNNKVYQFNMVETGKELIHIPANETDTYVINIHILREVFNEAILKYETKLRSDSETQHKFEEMYDKYGQHAFIED